MLAELETVRPEARPSAGLAAAADLPLEFVTRGGEPYVCVREVDRLEPFFMALVSASDLWLFAGSNGPFVAGRAHPDGALFPYQTVDRILAHPRSGGALSLFQVADGARWRSWEPWSDSPSYGQRRRHLYKHVNGTSVVFEEENLDLGLVFAAELTCAGPYGLVRQCELRNCGPASRQVRALDGWHQLLPPGVSKDLYAQFSYLATAYMRHEVVPGPPLALYTLNAHVTDRAEAAECLRVTAAWSLGHHSPTLLLSTRHLDAWRQGGLPAAGHEVRGEMGAYLVADEFGLPAGQAQAWTCVVDTGLDHAAIANLREQLVRPAHVAERLAAAVAANRQTVGRLLAAADGWQTGGDPTVAVHHRANVLYNCLRGGTLAQHYLAPRQDVAAFLGSRNRPLAQRQRDWLQSLPQELTLADLRRRAAATGDPQLARLAGEYLPLTFSRRHGDPSRPWNLFHIRVQDERGQPLYGYQGNWRDIFQNWESLALSFPDCLENMIAVFLNASSADGYNPYRLGREGIDWEVPDPANPWGHSGYWGDHQVIYLLRLLEAFERYQPGKLAARLGVRRYACARIPYAIAGFDALCRDPQHSIAFDRELHRRLMAQAETIGGDGKLASTPDGQVRLYSLAEKLLVPLLAKLSNLVPGGGIWLNTQRPEWNDANNALAGWGLSVVTVAYLRRYLCFLERLLAGVAGELPFTAAGARFLSELRDALGQAPAGAEQGAAARLALCEALGRAGERHRLAVYAEAEPDFVAVPAAALRELVAAALPVVDATLRANRRDDGLYHSYNVLELAPGAAHVRRLEPMLEGQVAMLSSGLPTPAEALALLRGLRRSALYRPDQNSYLLYPNRELPSFLARNTLPAGALERAPLLRRLVAEKDGTVVRADCQGNLHFAADLTNARNLGAALDRLAAAESWRAEVAAGRAAVLVLWEEVFQHQRFTGRSSSFFAFEGLGSIYWHMVAKLLLAAQECHTQALATAPPDVVAGLAAAYHEVRAGLGFAKSPAVFGAIPTDPYSHSPAHCGAQQPGMTGQVKEEILTRWGELGLVWREGRLHFEPRLLAGREFSREPLDLAWIDVAGQEQHWALPGGSLGFTCCQVAVAYVLAAQPGLTVWRAGGAQEELSGTGLSRADSLALAGRRGTLLRLRVQVVPQALAAGSDWH